MNADERFLHALADLSSALREIALPSMIIGGVAVIAAGVPRQTIDIDVALQIGTADIDRLLTLFARHHIVPRIPDALAFARERQVLLLIHGPSAVTIEVSFAWLPFEREALARANQVDFQGATIRVARPEDLIIYKAAAWRDRDRSDIERLLISHLHDLNIDRIRDLIGEIARALDDPGRLAAFDEMLDRARKSDL